MLLIIAIIIFYISYQVYQHYFPAPNINPNGKYVLISGCDSGFGQALAIELDKLGFNVFAGIFSENNKQLLSSKLSSRAIIFPLDITQQKDIDAALQLVQRKTNILHALVNNAGIITHGYIDCVSVDTMRNLMDVNFFGHVAMTKAFLPLLIAKQDSRVVNVCSVAGFISGPANSAYSASKFAFESFSDCLRREMGIWGLRVSIIEPGIMRTPIIEKHGLSVQKLVNELTDDVRQRWGDEYFQRQLEATQNNILLKYAEDPMKVVRALQHAVVSTAPCIRYRPGWQSKFVFFPLSVVPAWFTDIFFAKTRKINILPTGLSKQIKA